jgi:hypothetical protein
MAVNLDLNEGIKDKESRKFVRPVILAVLVFVISLFIASLFTKKDVSVGPNGIRVTTPISSKDTAQITNFNIKGDYINGDKKVIYNK